MFFALAAGVGLALFLVLSVAAQDRAIEARLPAAEQARAPRAVQANSVLTFTPVSTTYLPLVAGNRSSTAYYFDDFSNPNSGWYVGGDTNAQWSYQAGEYEILVNTQDWWAGVTAPVYVPIDYSVEADIRRTTGSLSTYGLIFGRKNWDQFYLFLVEPDSSVYSLWRKDGASTFTPLVNWTYSTRINGGSATNHLKVGRTGDYISLQVNDWFLTTVNDGTYTGMELSGGMYVESTSVVPLTTRFDNFEIRQYGATTYLGGDARSPETLPAAWGGSAPGLGR
jgi:hypothetical protein